MSEKTEPPTPKKIRDARKKGQFLFSREIVAGALLIGLTGVLFGLHETFIALLSSVLDATLDNAALPFEKVFPEVLDRVLIFGAVVLGPVLATNIIIAIITNVAQTGPVFSGAKISKGLQSVNFINNAKQLFTKRSLFNLLMSIIKLLLIGYIAFIVVHGFIGEFITSVICGFSCALWTAGRALISLFGILCAVYVPVAIIDFIFQRVFYMKEQRMSKEEVKREYKESEGNPEIKAQRRQAHQEILNENMMNNVRDATMVVKNPTHYAVALLYDEEKTPLPIVVGKGEGTMAREMLRVAEEAGVPVYENVDLAQSLFQDVEMGHYIAQQFITPVAEALRYIERLRQR